MRNFAYNQTSFDLSLPPLPWQIYPTLTASHFKFLGDNYPFGVPRKETTKKLRLLKSFGMFGGTMVYIDYTDHRSNIDVYTYDQLGFGFQLGQ